MNNEPVNRYYSPVPPLTPIYTEANLRAPLQKEEQVAEYIAVNSRPAEKSLLGSCVSIATVDQSPPSYQEHVNATASVPYNVVNSPKLVPVYEPVLSDDNVLMKGWEVITSPIYSPPAHQTRAEAKLATANDLVSFLKNTAANSRSSGTSSLESRGSIATVHHSLPAYQVRSETMSSVINTVISTSKRVSIFERVASEIDARFAKSDLILKAEKAAGNLLEAMSPASKTDAATAVNCFEKDMQEIFSTMDKFSGSTLHPKIKNEIAASFQKMTAEKFAESGSSVTAASIEKVRDILELADRNTVRQPDSTETSACRTIANQTLRIFQEQLFANLKIEAEQMIKDLLAAADPESKTTIATASKVFENKMITISAHRKHFKDHDLYKDFANNIKASLNRGANVVHSANVKKSNMADWKTKSKKLAEGAGTFVDDTYPKDIWTPQEILLEVLTWMKRKDFSNQIKASIKEVFPKRYEWIVTTYNKNEKDVTDTTNSRISSLKENLRKKCIAKNDQEIAKGIQENRKMLAPLLMAEDSRKLTINASPNSITIAINQYLESNETELDLAIGAMILDHIKDMQKSDLLDDN